MTVKDWAFYMAEAKIHANGADELRALLEMAAKDIRAWQEAFQPRPIASAPTSLLRHRINLYWPQRGWYTGHYMEQDKPPPRTPPCGCMGDLDQCVPKEQPTHWMPLPARPQRPDDASRAEKP